MTGHRRDAVEGRRARFERDGFLVLENFVSADACMALRARAEALVDEIDVAGPPTVFSTTEPDRHAQDAYFLNSGDKIRLFYEDGAFGRDGALRVPKPQAINKIGHALHDLDPTFDAFSRTHDLASLVHEIGMRAPLLLQSMLIFKQPRIGGVVVAHQDATFLRTEPQSVLGLWFALEDADGGNGCLRVLPGGHRGGVRAHFRRLPRGTTRTEIADPTPWPDADFIPLEVPVGTLVVLHGRLPHASGVNRSDRSRLAYTLHLIDGTADYPADNWLQRAPDMPLRGFG